VERRTHQAAASRTAHADDLRVEVADQGERGEALVAALREGYEEAPPAAEISAADRAMLDFAVKLTGEPRSITCEDLRAAGFSDTGFLYTDL
jgi:hypothetical protein